MPEQCASAMCELNSRPVVRVTHKENRVLQPEGTRASMLAHAVSALIDMPEVTKCLSLKTENCPF